MKTSETRRKRHKKGPRSGLQKKILLFTVIPTVLAFVLAYLFTAKTAETAIGSVTDTLLESRAQQVSNKLDGYFAGYLAQVRTLQSDPVLAQMFDAWAAQKDGKPDASAERLEAAIDGYMNNVYNVYSDELLDVFMADVKTQTLIYQEKVDGGALKEGDYDLNSRPWFQELQSSSTGLVVTEPYQDLTTGKIVVSVIGSVTENGSVTGVVGLDITLDYLGQLGKSFTSGSNFLVITSKDGYILYHPDSALQNKNLTDEKIDSRLASLLQSKSGDDTKQRAGTARFTMQGKDAVGVAASGADTGWNIVYGTDYSSYTSAVRQMDNRLVLLYLGIVLVLSVLVLIIGRAIVKPLSSLTQTANRIADGEVDLTIDVHTNDETGVLAEAFGRIVERLKTYMQYIDEICGALDKMAEGDYTLRLQCDYIGEFARIKDALLNTQTSVASIVRMLQENARNVTGGAEQVAAAAQSLAQGATEQSSAVSELTETLDGISAQVSQSAEQSQLARQRTSETSENIRRSDAQMKQLQAAMEAISAAANQIGKINKTIDDIAFQTNILALNAAVEAARAGSAGKGFAVVADEVRNLAGKSAEAAKTTQELVQQALAAVRNGNDMSRMVGETLKKSVESAEAVVNVVDSISDASAAQAQSIAQVAQGVSQIATVVETNSAAAEESAALGQQFSKEAETLDKLVGRFKLPE